MRGGTREGGTRGGGIHGGGAHDDVADDGDSATGPDGGTPDPRGAGARDDGGARNDDGAGRATGGRGGELPGFEEARLIAHGLGAGRRTGMERLPVLSGETGGPARYLAGDVAALAPLPPADTAAMDGFAVAGEGPWRVVGDLFAGGSAAPLAPGQALRTATGAALPEGAEAVLAWEDVCSLGDFRSGAVASIPAPGSVGRRNIRRRGEEADAGEAIARAGDELGPLLRGFAAAAGHDTLPVHVPPSVGVLVTGEELRREGLPGTGTIRDGLSPLLGPLVASWGGTLAGLTWPGDDRDAVRAFLRSATADVLVTTGMAADGPRDHVRSLLEELGAEVLVPGTALRPGRTQALALLPDGRIVVALPGNPLAAVAAAHTLLQPLLAGMTSRGLPPARVVELLDAPERRPGITQLMPARLDPERPGVLRALPWRRSAQLRGLAQADALAILPGTSAPARALFFR